MVYKKSKIAKGDYIVIPVGSEIFYCDWYFGGGINKKGRALEPITVRVMDNDFDIEETGFIGNHKAEIKQIYKGYWDEQRSKKA
jgi:hypothetical protein